MTYRCIVGSALLFATASVALGHAELEVQIAAVTKRIEQEPGNAALYLRRGELHRIHREWNLARSDYDRAEQFDPRMAGVDLARGQMLLDAGQPNRALAPLSRLLQRLPDNADGHALRARAWIALKDTESALADYNAAVSNATVHAVDYYGERAQLIALIRPDEAVHGLDEGIARLGPVGTLEQQAIALRVAQGKYDDAVTRLDMVMARSSRKETLLLQRAQILEKGGHLTEAAQSCRQALAALDTLPPYRRRVPAMLDLEAAIRSLLQRLDKKDLAYANH